MSNGSNNETLVAAPQETMHSEEPQTLSIIPDLDNIAFDSFLDGDLSSSISKLSKPSSESEAYVLELALKKIKILEHRIRFYQNNAQLNSQNTTTDEELDQVHQQIQKENIKFPQHLQNAIDKKEAELKNILESGSDEYLSSDESSTDIAPQATPLQDFPRDKLSYLFSGEQDNLASDWEQTGKKESGAVKPAEHTGFYRHKHHPEYKVFIKQDSDHPENDYVEFLLSRIMRDIAEEIELDPQLIAQIELLHTHVDDSKTTISKEKNVYIASGFFTNYQDLWKDAYLAFLTLDSFSDHRKEYFKTHPQAKISFPKRRPHFFENDEIINLVINSGRYQSYQSIKELSRTMREVDTHFENIGVTTGKFTENNKSHLVVVNKRTLEIIPVRDSDNAKNYPEENYKHYHVFEQVDACRIDLGAGLGDERNTFKEFKYSDSRFYNISKLRPIGGPPPQFWQGPKELEESPKRLVILSRIASLSKEFLSEVFQAAAHEANKYFGEEISRRVAIKKLGMDLDEVNNLSQNLVPNMGDFFAETFIENQAKPIKILIETKLKDLEKDSKIKDFLQPFKDEINANLNKISIKPSLKRQINKWERELLTLSDECQIHYNNVSASQATSQDKDLDSLFLKDINDIKSNIDNKITSIKQLTSLSETDSKLDDFVQLQKTRITSLVNYYEIKKTQLSTLNYCHFILKNFPDSNFRNQLTNLVDLIAKRINQNLEEKNNIGLLRNLIQLSTSLAGFIHVLNPYNNEQNDINHFLTATIPLLSRFVALENNCKESDVLLIDELIQKLCNYREAIKHNPRLNAKSDKLLAYQYDQLSHLLQAALNKEDNYEARLKAFTEHLHHSTILVTDLTALNKNINNKEIYQAQHANAFNKIDDKQLTQLLNSGNKAYKEGCDLALHCLTNPKTSLNDLTLITNSIGTTNTIITCVTSNDVKQIQNLPKYIESLQKKSVEQIKTKPTNWKKFAGIGLAIVGTAIAITAGLFWHFGITIPIAIGGVKLTIGGLAWAGISIGGSLASMTGIGLFAKNYNQPLTKSLLNVADNANEIYSKLASAPESIREVPVRKP